MNKIFIIHCGLHKTGTTSIQINCSRYADLLLNAGIYYPKFSPSTWVNHSVPLSIMFMDNPRTTSHTVRKEYSDDEAVCFAANTLKTYLMNEISVIDAQKILFSGEDLSVFSDKELRKLAGFIKEIGAVETEVVVFVRHPINFILSNAQELIKAGLTTLKAALHYGNLQQIKVKINKFQCVFGSQNVKVVSFDDAIKKTGDISKYFFDMLGVALPETGFQKSNEAMPLEKILVLSACVRLGLDVIPILNKTLSNNGTRLAPGRVFGEQAWELCKDDIEFVLSQFNVKFEKQFNVSEPGLDRCQLLVNLYRAKEIVDVDKVNGFEISSVFCSIIEDLEAFFPELAANISAMAYNCFPSETFKKYIDYYVKHGLLIGYYLDNIFILRGEEIEAVDFDADAYLQQNPDVLNSKVDPFKHYYAFGRFEKRKSI
jgi:hypothetical protein